MLSRTVSLTRALPPGWRITVKPVGPLYLVTLMNPHGIVQLRASAASQSALTSRIRRFHREADRVYKSALTV